jgi:hypothetical protein
MAISNPPCTGVTVGVPVIPSAWRISRGERLVCVVQGSFRRKDGNVDTYTYLCGYLCIEDTIGKKHLQTLIQQIRPLAKDYAICSDTHYKPDNRYDSIEKKATLVDL